MPRMTDNTRAKILELYRGGMRQIHIAETLGFSLNTVHSYIQRCRNLGIIPKPVRSGGDIMRTSCRYNEIKLGRMRDIYELLTPEMAKWVVSQVPKNSTLLEFLYSLTVDAYYEQNPEESEEEGEKENLLP